MADTIEDLKKRMKQAADAGMFYEVSLMANDIADRLPEGKVRNQFLLGDYAALMKQATDEAKRLSAEGNHEVAVSTLYQARWMANAIADRLPEDKVRNQFLLGDYAALMKQAADEAKRLSEEGNHAAAADVLHQARQIANAMADRLPLDEKDKIITYSVAGGGQLVVGKQLGQSERSCALLVMNVASVDGSNQVTTFGAAGCKAGTLEQLNTVFDKEYEPNTTGYDSYKAWLAACENAKQQALKQ